MTLQLLQEIGLDFSFLIDTLLVPPSAPTKRRPSNAREASTLAADAQRANGNSPLLPPMPLNIVNRNLERARSPMGVPDPGSPQRSPGLSTQPPGPLPPRSRERPMSGNVTPKPKLNLI